MGQSGLRQKSWSRKFETVNTTVGRLSLQHLIEHSRAGWVNGHHAWHASGGHQWDVHRHGAICVSVLTGLHAPCQMLSWLVAGCKWQAALNACSAAWWTRIKYRCRGSAPSCMRILSRRTRQAARAISPLQHGKALHLGQCFQTWRLPATPPWRLRLLTWQDALMGPLQQSCQVGAGLRRCSHA